MEDDESYQLSANVVAEQLSTDEILKL